MSNKLKFNAEAARRDARLGTFGMRDGSAPVRVTVRGGSDLASHRKAHSGNRPRTYLAMVLNSTRMRWAEAHRTGLPPIWRGPRRRYLTLLVATGLSQALLAGLGAHALRQMLSPSGSGPHGASHQPRYMTLLVVLLALTAVVVGVLRMTERVLTEQLSQDYVHEVRLGLLRRNLTEGLQGSLGVTVTRTSNDLTSVRNWISMGIAPLVLGVPLIGAAAVAVSLLHPAFVLALLMPIAVLILALCTLAQPTFERTRALRKTRGRLSAHIADAMLATTAIRAGGGAVRELNKMDRMSREMIAAAIRKARWAGALRGAGAASSGLAIASAAGIGLLLSLPASTIAAALTLFGFLATPLSDIGRSAEFRQAYRAAARIIGPAIQPTPEAETPVDMPVATREADVPVAMREADVPVAIPVADVPAAAPMSSAPKTPTADEPSRSVVADAVMSRDGNALPTLVAEPGDRVVVDLGDRRETSSLLARFAGLEPLDGSIDVAGRQLRGASHGRLRRLVGYAAQGLMLGRGTIANAVRYRAMDAPDSVVYELLDAVGLSPRVKDLPKGAETVLKHGGEPLTTQERALVQLARALLNSPPLLVLDHLDGDLGVAGRETLRRLLVNYSGTVLIAGDHAAEIVTPTHVWRRDTVARPGGFWRLQPRATRRAEMR